MDLKMPQVPFYQSLCEVLRRCRLLSFRSELAALFGRIDRHDTWVVAYVDDLLISSEV